MSMRPLSSVMKTLFLANLTAEVSRTNARVRFCWGGRCRYFKWAE